MGIFDRNKKGEEELISEFQTKGFKCETVIGSVGRSAGNKAAATLMFGLAGFAATSGKKDQKATGYLYMKEKGLRFIPEEEKYIEIRIPWEDLIHVGSGPIRTVYIYTGDDSSIIFKFTKDVHHFCKDVISVQTNLLKDDLEGWE